MKCEDCRVLFEDHFDRALDASRTRLVNAHLESCQSCFAEYELIRNEQQVYARYQRDIDVTPALWASIERRINAEAAVGKPQKVQQRDSLLGRLFAPLSGLRLSPALVAAMVALAIGTTVVVTRYIERRADSGQQQVAQDQAPSGGEKAEVPPSKAGNAEPDETKQPPSIPVQVAADTSSSKHSGQQTLRASAPRKLTAAELIRDAENKYLSAIAMLSRDAKQREATLDPAARVRFETALAIIDNTIQETRQAVRQNPNDPIALQYLLTAYGKKVEALREMARE